MASIKLKGDTSGEVIISAPSVAGNTTLELPATSSTLATQNSLGVRNLIINGDMRIAQRGTSVSSISSGATYNTIDRMRFGVNSLGTWTQSQSTEVPTGQGFAKSFKLDCTTADASPSASDYAFFNYNIEGQNLQHLKKGTANAESVTMSFWVKSNKTGTYTFELDDNDNDRSISKTYTVDSANTWEKKTITIEGDTTGTLDNDNNNSLRFYFWLGAGSNFTSGTLQTSWQSTIDANRVSSSNVNLGDSTNNEWYITGVQLEVGTEATPFEHRPYDMEFQRCQRYYTNVYHNQFCAAVYEPNGDTRTQVLPIGTMRASPTLNPSSYSAHSINLGVNGNAVNTPTATWNLTVNHAGNNYYSIDTNQNGAVAYPSGTSVIIVGAHGVGTITCDAEL